MSEERDGGGKGGGSALLKEHLPMLGRVAMALLGDEARVGEALETVARETGGRMPPEGGKPIVWLLGMVRSACATQLSRLPMRGAMDASAEAPKTERLGAADAVPARALLGALRPTEREAVVMSLVARLDAADVATVCNTDLATARLRIGRGMEQLLRDSANANEGGSR